MHVTFSLSVLLDKNNTKALDFIQATSLNIYESQIVTMESQIVTPRALP